MKTFFWCGKLLVRQIERLTDSVKSAIVRLSELWCFESLVPCQLVSWNEKNSFSSSVLYLIFVVV